jgi:hypothetical protein
MGQERRSAAVSSPYPVSLLDLDGLPPPDQPQNDWKTLGRRETDNKARKKPCKRTKQK